MIQTLVDWDQTGCVRRTQKRRANNNRIIIVGGMEKDARFTKGPFICAMRG